MILWITTSLFFLFLLEICCFFVFHSSLERISSSSSPSSSPSSSSPSLNVDSVDHELFQSVIDGNVGKVENLLKSGNKPNIRDGKYGNTLLIWACMYNQSDIIDILLSYGAEIEAMSSDGLKSPLLTTIFQGNQNIITQLLIHGANVNGKNSRGDTAISIATYKEDIDVMKILLQRKPYLNSQTLKHGYTPLHIAAMKCNQEISYLLYSHGSNVEIKDKIGQYPQDIVDKKCKPAFLIIETKVVEKKDEIVIQN